VALPLAFDHVPLDQFLNITRIEGSQEVRMYLPISVGSVVVIVLVLWLIGVV
jgi:hypothetical protein